MLRPVVSACAAPISVPMQDTASSSHGSNITSRRYARISAVSVPMRRQRSDLILHPSLPVISAENASISAVISGNDEILIRFWLNARSEHTWRAYEADIRGRLATIGRPIASTNRLRQLSFSANTEIWIGKIVFTRAQRRSDRQRRVARLHSRSRGTA